MGCEALETMLPHPIMDDHESASGHGDCEHQGGRELGLCDMVNKCESLINVVTHDKRKMLTRLNQKVEGQEWMLIPHLSQMLHPRRKGGT